MMLSKIQSLIKPQTFKHWFVLNLVSAFVVKINDKAAEGATGVSEFQIYCLIHLLFSGLYLYYSYNFCRALLARGNKIGAVIIALLMLLTAVMGLAVLKNMFTI